MFLGMCHSCAPALDPPCLLVGRARMSAAEEATYYRHPRSSSPPLPRGRENLCAPLVRLGFWVAFFGGVRHGRSRLPLPISGRCALIT